MEIKTESSEIFTRSDEIVKVEERGGEKIYCYNSVIFLEINYCLFHPIITAIGFNLATFLLSFVFSVTSITSSTSL